MQEGSKSGIRRRGLMLVLSSPSGAGKTTITRSIIQRDPELTISISVTTRPQRPGEIEQPLAARRTRRDADPREQLAEPRVHHEFQRIAPGLARRGHVHPCSFSPPGPAVRRLSRRFDARRFGFRMNDLTVV